MRETMNQSPDSSNMPRPDYSRVHTPEEFAVHREYLQPPLSENKLSKRGGAIRVEPVAPNSRLDYTQRLQQLQDKVDAMEIRDLLFALEIEDIRKKPIIASPTKGIGSKEHVHIPVPVSRAKIESLVKQLLRTDAIGRLESSQLTRKHMEMVAKSKLLQEYFFHQRIVQEVQATVHPRITNDLQKY